MHLRDYLADPASLTVSALRIKMNSLGADVGHDAQIRQWIQLDEHGNFKRHPRPHNAYYLELATNGKVARQDMRPHDWSAIWPELQAPGGVDRRVGPATRRIGPADRRKARR